MRIRIGNHAIRLATAVALLLTGAPLLARWLPERPLAPLPGAAAALIPGEIVIDLKDGTDPARFGAVSSRLGLSYTLNSVHARRSGLLLARVAPGREEAVLAQLRRENLVEAAAQNSTYSASWTPNDPRYPEQWNLHRVGAEKAWERSRGKGVTVAVIDTGVAAENDERCYQASDFTETTFTRGYDFVHDDDHPYDDHGHGTHVAGTVAESTNNGRGVAGLAFEATVMPLKVLTASGTGTSVDIADAIRYAADHGAQVINMSLGGPLPDPIMRLACRYAQKKGVLIVCAAGNSRGSVGYPAGFPECMAVSAIDPRGELAWYSSRGRQVAIAAPGGDTREGSQNGVLQNTVMTEAGERRDDYFAFQGTSMASPHVAAAAALVMAAGERDAQKVRRILENSAEPRFPREHYGAGILNAAGAVGAASLARTTGDGRRGLGMLLVAATLAAGILAGYRTRRLGVPWLTFGFALGYFVPDWWDGSLSPWGILVHGALVPLYLLWEMDSRRAYRFLAALSVGMAVHLLLDLVLGSFSPTIIALAGRGECDRWLFVNTLVAVGVAIAAYRRSYLARDR